MLFLKRQHWQNTYWFSHNFSVSVRKFPLSLFALRVLCSCCLLAYSKWRQDNEKGGSLPRCFGFQFVTMAAAATSCRSGSSCVHSFLCARSRGVTKALCLHCHIWGFMNKGHRASPDVKKRPWTVSTHTVSTHVHAHTQIHKHTHSPVSCSFKALKTSPICTQLSPLTVQWSVNGYATREGFQGTVKQMIKQIKSGLSLLFDDYAETFIHHSTQFPANNHYQRHSPSLGFFSVLLAVELIYLFGGGLKFTFARWKLC